MDQSLTPAANPAVRLEGVGFDSPADSTHSFEVFYAEHRSTIGRALAVALRNDHLAAEALDEAMTRAYQRWDHVQQLASPSGWVFTVGLNWSRSVWRRSLRSASLARVASCSPTSARFADPDLDRALRDLTVDQRAVIVCRYLIGYSESDTARVLGIRPGTVKSRLHRALGSLRKSLTIVAETTSNDARGTRESNEGMTVNE